MNIELKNFQSDASAQILEELRLAKHEIGTRGKLEAVILSAPTGSGKTIIATEVIERVLEGYDSYAPEADAVFLWLTDQPQLNEQTRRKILLISSVLCPSRLIMIDSAFDEELFSGGNVYFLNTQKLGREKNLVETGDKRMFTIWQTISHTIQHTPTKFYLIIDEAHRGMGTTVSEKAQAETIVQKFIIGSAGEIPPVHLVIGISATPERFRNLLQGTPRISRPVNVDPSDVRTSGLIKDYVRFRTPKDDTPSDITLLRSAVERWNTYKTTWSEYCQSENMPAVKPLLIIQVEDGDKTRLTKTNLKEVITAIEDITGTFPPNAYAHSFQEGISVSVGSSRTIRYLAPSDITDDANVQVVFFKTSLSTGWDCPRAEVIMSFRRAVDATSIAQLVGRMVRTPLARRVDKNEMLNSVTLLLPHYEATELKKVVARLNVDDSDVMPPTGFVDDDEVQDLKRAKGLEQCFDIAVQIPTYIIPSRGRMSEVRRMMKLSRLLVNDNISENAIDEGKAILFAVLDSEYTAHKNAQRFKDAVSMMSKIAIEEHTFTFGEDIGHFPSNFWIDSSEQNVEDRFGEAGRSIGEGLHISYWRHRTNINGDPRLAKCETMALLQIEGMPEKIVEVAKRQTNEWLQKFQNAFFQLGDRQKQAYNEVRKVSKEPSESKLTFPTGIEVLKSTQDASWIKHIYVTEKNVFETYLDSWETAVMLHETENPDVIGWLRNIPHKSYALCVPYKNADNKWAGLYPDFLVFRRNNEGVFPEIVDPHLVHLDDAFRKAKGLAEYVDKHPEVFRRVIIARLHDGAIQRLDLADEGVRHEVRTVSSNDHLRSLYNILSTT